MLYVMSQGIFSLQTGEKQDPPYVNALSFHKLHQFMSVNINTEGRPYFGDF